MERGTGKAAEDGPGVGVSIGRRTRVRPLLRLEAEYSQVSKNAVILSGATRSRRIFAPHDCVDPSTRFACSG